MDEDVVTDRSPPAEQALRDIKQRFHTIFESGPVGIALLDRDGRYLSVNPVRQEMLGYSEEELRGRHYLDVTHPDDIELDVQVNAEARVLRKDQYQFEKRFVRRDGQTVWSRMTIAVVRNDAGEHEYSVSVAEDITEQKRVEAERARLFELERDARIRIERLAAERSAILAQVAEGIVIVDPNGTITFVNEAAQQIHGEPAVPEGRTYAERYVIISPDGTVLAPGTSPLSRAALFGESTVDDEWYIRRPDGREVAAQGSATQVVGDDGTPLGAVLTVRDITAQRQFEQEKDDFLSAAAHDLRTPLTTIKGHTQILQKRVDGPDLPDRALMLRALDRIDAGATRMISLVNDLLDVANIQFGQGAMLNRRPTDLVALARDIAGEHGAITAAHVITVHADASEITGCWDADRLGRVLANLLSNATKYSPDGGNIDVGVRQEDRHAVLTVQDEGVGIPSSDLPYIFNRFRRGENVSGRIAGTGIGLAAVRRIVEQHGGTVSAVSQENKGSIFTVYLPLEVD
jgi:PAS domain S-box-containing protein